MKASSLPGYAAAAVAAAGIMFLIRMYGLEKAVSTTDSILNHTGSLSFILFIVIYSLATMIALPGYPFSIMAGSYFGVLPGFAVSMGATCAAASLQFLIARYIAAGAVRGRLEKRARFRKIDSLTVSRSGTVVTATRLIPLFPFSFLNYGFGVTGISFGSYLLWTVIGMIPWTLIYVTGGDVLKYTVLSQFAPSASLLILAAALIAVIFLIRWAKSQLSGF